MGRISTVVFCENANIENANGATKLNCNGVMARAAVPAIPSFLSLSLLVIADISDPEAKIETIRIVIKSPDGTTVFDQSLPGNQMPIIEDEKKDLSIAMNIQNLVIRTLGKYTFEFYFNGDVDYSKEFEIFQKAF